MAKRGAIFKSIWQREVKTLKAHGKEKSLKAYGTERYGQSFKSPWQREVPYLKTHGKDKSLKAHNKEIQSLKAHGKEKCSLHNASKNVAVVSFSHSFPSSPRHPSLSTPPQPSNLPSFSYKYLCAL